MDIIYPTNIYVSGLCNDEMLYFLRCQPVSILSLTRQVKQTGHCAIYDTSVRTILQN